MFGLRTIEIGMPSRKVDGNYVDTFKGLKLADQDFAVPRKIDLILEPVCIKVSFCQALNSEAPYSHKNLSLVGSLLGQSHLVLRQVAESTFLPYALQFKKINGKT